MDVLDDRDARCRRASRRIWAVDVLGHLDLQRLVEREDEARALLGDTTSFARGGALLPPGASATTSDRSRRLEQSLNWYSSAA